MYIKNMHLFMYIYIYTLLYIYIIYATGLRLLVLCNSNFGLWLRGECVHGATITTQNGCYIARITPTLLHSHMRCHTVFACI